METLFRSFRTQLEHTSTEVVRFLHDQIAWDSRLVAILGARGVGKTTLLLQHIKLYVRMSLCMLRQMISILPSIGYSTWLINFIIWVGKNFILTRFINTKIGLGR